MSHCGICGSDLHFLIEWGGRTNVDRGPRVLGHRRRGRRRRRGLGGRRPGARRARRPVRQVRVLPRADGASSASSGAGSAADGSAGRARSPRYKTVTAAEALRDPRRALAQARRAHRAARGRVARHHAGRRRPARHALARDRRRADRLPLRRRAEGARRRRHRRERTARSAAARCARSSARARSTPEELVTPPMPHDIVDEPFDVALECSGNGRAQESALAQLKRAGTLVLVGAGMARPKFDPNRILLERARDHRRVRVRPRRLPARARAARVGQDAERPARRAGGLSR